MRVFRWTMGSGIVMSLAPIIGVLVSMVVAQGLGCRVHEGAVQPCPLWGMDIGGPLYSLFVTGWLSIVTLPVCFTLIAIWLVAEVVHFRVQRRKTAS